MWPHVVNAPLMAGGRCFAATAYSSPTQRQPARALMLWQTTCYRAPCNREKRNRIVKTKVIVLMLLAVGAVFAQLSVGVRIGAPPPRRGRLGLARTSRG